MTRNNNLRAIMGVASVLASALIFASPAVAQSGAAGTNTDDPCKPGYVGDAKCEDSPRPSTTPALPPAAAIKSLDSFIKDKVKIEGLFTIYRDDATGKHFMEVREDQLGQEFIYFSYVHNGSANVQSRLAGTLRDNAVFRIRRTMNRIDFFMADTEYEFGASGPLTRLQGRNITQPLLTTEAIVARSSDQKVHLIDVSKMFTRNAFVRVGSGSGAPVIPGLPSLSATLSTEDSTISQVRNYPENLNIISEYVLRMSGATSPRGSSDTIALQHSFLAMPQGGFEPRLADPRVGYFTSRKTDLSESEGSPVRDVIHRWRLEKSDPNAAISPAKTPIVFWIENTTPLAYRPIILDAVKSWNRAFEVAGISNAVDARVQPDDATWDGGDVRYHLISWNASPTPRYLGYGPTFTNPRTGEILGADIVLEHASLARSIRTDRLFQARPNPINGYANADDHHHSDHDAGEDCLVGHDMAIGMAYASISAQIGQGARFQTESALREAIIREGLRYLVIHEVGHTLGLTHNMMGSAAVPLRSLSGPGSANVQPSASVMDYPAINIAPRGAQQGKFFPDQVGPYDIWAIQFGYDSRLKDPAALTAHMSRSTQKEHRLGNDGDLISGPDRGIDPRVNTFDLSDDPVGFGEQQIVLAWQTMPLLMHRLVGRGDSNEEVVAGFRLLLANIERAGLTAARHIGGVYVERTVGGQVATQPLPHTPVPVAQQRRAMAMLAQRIFAPDAFDFSPELLGSLQRYRRGFDLASGLTRQDITINALVRSLQSSVIFTLLHDRTLRRISDTALYGNGYSVYQMTRDLNDSIFAVDLAGDVNGFRRNLQVDFVRQVATQWRSNRLDAQSEAALLAILERIKAQMQSAARVGSSATQAHRRYIYRLVNDALEPGTRAR